jgi:hypothetical protein
MTVTGITPQPADQVAREPLVIPEVKTNPAVKVLAGLPTYDGMRWNGNAIGSMYVSNIDTFEVASSLLTASFNRCWCEALNKRGDPAKGGITHFLLMHADIVPADFDWFQQLWEEFEKNQCKVLSVAVPIKAETGITSTAIETENLWKPRRLTVSEILDMPVTWTSTQLLVNTGLLLVDFREPWVERICFTINDRIHKLGGKWECNVEPEDWNFSRQCRALGVDPWVTRRVALSHMGRATWRNDKRWGQPVDPDVLLTE